MSPTTRVALSIAGVVLVVWYILSSDYAPATVSPVDWIQSASSRATKRSSPYVRRVKLNHPIPTLMDEADLAYRQKLSKQSKTLKQAATEYRKRYKRHPPRGFDKWFQFAKDNDFKMMDEFDSMMEELEPFWVLEPLEIRRRTTQARNLSFLYILSPNAY